MLNNKTFTTMKVKKLLFACLCTLCIGPLELQATNPKETSIFNEVTTLPEGFETIILNGDLVYNIGPNAIEAGVNATEVYIQFNQSFGSVSISLYNGSNTLVYHATVNTDVQPIVIIPLNGADEGSYFLEIDSVSGSSEGGFDHTNN